MAKTEQAKQRNAQALILANQTYPKYKEYITKELFFSEFGVSYKTIQEFQDSWRDIVAYNPKCEDFLKFKTRTFLRMLPIDNELYTHPRFLRILTRQISNYLARYIARKDENSDRVTIADQLYQELHNNNSFIKHKQDVFCGKQGVLQTQPKETQPRERRRIGQIKAEPVHISKQEKRNLETKSVNARLREAYKKSKNSHLFMLSVSIKINEK